MNLEGKTAIMFGAGAIGKSIANSLVAEGMNLVVVSRATTDRKPSSEILVDSLENSPSVFTEKLYSIYSLEKLKFRGSVYELIIFWLELVFELAALLFF